MAGNGFLNGRTGSMSGEVAFRLGVFASASWKRKMEIIKRIKFIARFSKPDLPVLFVV